VTPLDLSGKPSSNEQVQKNVHKQQHMNRAKCELLHLDCEPLAIVHLWLQIGRASASQDHFRSPRLSCGLHNARVLPRVPGVIVGKTGEACVAMVAEAWEEVLEEPRSSARISGKEL